MPWEPWSKTRFAGAIQSLEVKFKFYPLAVFHICRKMQQQYNMMPVERSEWVKPLRWEIHGQFSSQLRPGEVNDGTNAVSMNFGVALGVRLAKMGRPEIFRVSQNFREFVERFSAPSCGQWCSHRLRARHWYLLTWNLPWFWNGTFLNLTLFRVSQKKWHRNHSLQNKTGRRKNGENHHDFWTVWVTSKRVTWLQPRVVTQSQKISPVDKISELVKKMPLERWEGEADKYKSLAKDVMKKMAVIDTERKKWSKEITKDLLKKKKKANESCERAKEKAHEEREKEQDIHFRSGSQTATSCAKYSIVVGMLRPLLERQLMLAHIFNCEGARRWDHHFQHPPLSSRPRACVLDGRSRPGLSTWSALGAPGVKRHWESQENSGRHQGRRRSS